VSRKRKKAKDAVPDEILAEGSGPHQDADSLAEAASLALADDATADDAAEVGQPTELASDEVLYEAAPVAEPVARKRRGKRTNAARDGAANVAGLSGDDVAAHTVDTASDAAMAALLADSEVGPELEEAEVEAEQAARADEQGLEEAVMRAEAEAELGTAEPEAEAGEEDLVLGAALPTTAASMDDLQLKHLVEALIFAADKPVTLQRLRQLTRVSDVKRLEAALSALAEDFADRGIALQKVSGGYQFRTNTQFSVWVQQLIAGRPVRLSRAQLETLAIVAYRQPITRPEVDDIRGVDSSATLRLLMDRSLIRILGKKEDVGRPLLYGTTREFLDFFSLGDLRELPTLREYSELSAESRQVMSDRLGLDADGTIDVGDVGDVGAVGVGEDTEIVDGMDVASAPEPTVEELVREFAQSDLDTHVGTDVAAMDASAVAEARDEMTAADEHMTAAAADDMTAAAEGEAAVASAAASPDAIESDASTSSDEATSSSDDALKSAAHDAAGGESASDTDATAELSVSRTLDSTDEPPTD